MSPRSNSALFLECLVNTEHRLCGLKLKPHSIFHLLWLEHIEGPLLSSDKRVTMRDLELAAIICSSQEQEEVVRNISRPPLFFHWRNRVRNVETEARAWLAYFNDYFSLPEFYEKSSSGGASFPWLILCVGSLVRETGWSLETVLRMPVGQAVWLNLSFGYLNSGETNVIGDEERRIMAQVTKGS